MPKSRMTAVLQAFFAGVLGKWKNLSLSARWLLLASTASVAAHIVLGGYIPTATRAQVGPVWQPAPGTSWQWQLQGEVNTTFNVDAYDVDGFDNSAAKVEEIHARGSKAICYISAGSWEDWRPDASHFPGSVKGRNNGWPGEKWLDIRQIGILQPIMARRMDMCLAKGFDAVEPDNIDGYTNRTGFPLTYQHQLAYNRMLASEAHARGLAIALKNDTDQVQDLVVNFDFAIVEQCYRYRECGAYSPFVEAGKAVLTTEYDTKNTASKCDRVRQLRFSLIFKKLALDEWVRFC